MFDFRDDTDKLIDGMKGLIEMKKKVEHYDQMKAMFDSIEQKVEHNDRQGIKSVTWNFKEPVYFLVNDEFKKANIEIDWS